MPTNPDLVDYGYDLGMDPTLTDLDPDMGELGGRLLLAQSCARRLITARGTLIDDPNYGTDLRQYLNDDVDARKIGLIASQVDAEMVKDQRIIRSNTTVTFLGGVLIVVVRITDLAGPFSLTLSVNNLSVSILAVSR